MFRRILSFVSVAMVSVSLAACSQQAGAGADSEARMKKCEAMAKPGPEHEMLQKACGTWTTVTKVWMDPKAEPVVCEGESVIKPMLDGRYVKEKFESTINDKPYKGVGVMGYDKMRGKYVSIWLDDMSTSPVIMHGTYDKAKRESVMTGTCYSPCEGKMKLKAVLRHCSDDKCIFTMYKVGFFGQEQKMMETTYTRKE